MGLPWSSWVGHVLQGEVVDLGDFHQLAHVAEKRQEGDVVLPVVVFTNTT